MNLRILRSLGGYVCCRPSGTADPGRRPAWSGQTWAPGSRPPWVPQGSVAGQAAPPPAECPHGPRAPEFRATALPFPPHGCSPVPGGTWPLFILHPRGQKPRRLSGQWGPGGERPALPPRQPPVACASSEGTGRGRLLPRQVGSHCVQAACGVGGSQPRDPQPQLPVPARWDWGGNSGGLQRGQDRGLAGGWAEAQSAPQGLGQVRQGVPTARGPQGRGSLAGAASVPESECVSLSSEPP